MREPIHDLTKLRAKRNMTQQHLAAAAEVSIRTVKRAEAGDVISPTTKASLLAALNIFDETSASQQADFIFGERRVVAVHEFNGISGEGMRRVIQQYGRPDLELDAWIKRNPI